MKKLALVLGGGAAKGYAHIGVLKALEKQGIVPDLIVGTSMGALVGGLYASGKKICELEEMAKNFNSIGSFDLISTLFKENIINVNKVKKILDKEFGNKTYEDCKIKFAVVATEIESGKEHRFTSGLLKESVMASISIPGIFPKAKINGETYVDGGLVNNLPEDVARELMPDALVVSIDVIGEYSKQLEKCKIKALESALNAMTLMLTNVVKNKPQDADIRLSMTLPSVSQIDFRSSTTEKSIRKGELFTKKHITKIMEMLKEE